MSNPYFQQPQFYQGISPNEMPMFAANGNSSFLQRAQAVNPSNFAASPYDGNQIFDSPSPLLIQKQVPMI